MADTIRRVDPPQCVDGGLQPRDRGIETTEPALVERHVDQCQLHAPLVAAVAVERRLAQRAFDRLFVLAQILVVHRVGHRQRCSLPRRRVRTDQGFGLGDRSSDRAGFTEPRADLGREDQGIDQAQRVAQRAIQLRRAQ